MSSPKAGLLLGVCISLAGWLFCAALCLALTVHLEAWPAGYDAVLWPALLVLFGNIFVFIFTASRWGSNNAKLCAAVCGIALVESLIFALLYVWGRYYIGV